MKSITNFTKTAVENFDRIDGLVDNHLEGIKDYTDTAADIIGPVKTIFSIVGFVKSRKFKAFLKSYANEIKKGNGEINSEFAERLRTYLKSPKNLNMIYEGIDASINSSSVYSANCIGYIAGSQLAGMYETNNKILILINAFKNLNDFELFSAINILKSVKDYDVPQNVNQLGVISIGTDSLYTAEKLKTLQVVSTYHPTKKMIVNVPGGFFMSDISEEFMSIIVDSGTYSKMEKDFSK
jgi:hypothetical protein